MMSYISYGTNRIDSSGNKPSTSMHVPSSQAHILQDVSVPGYPEVYTEIDHETKKVLLIIPFKSQLELDSVPLSVGIGPDAKSNIVVGEKYDLTKPFALKITDKDKSTVSYAIEASKCDGSKSALIISDTQNDIIPLYRQTRFFENSNLVMKKAYKAKVPIYYIMLSELKGSSKWDLPPQLLNYKTGIIVDKPNTVDAFEVESFYVGLLKKGIGRVYVIGVSSMGCVKGTSEGAIKRKFDLVLVSNAHSEPIGYRDEAAIDECNELFKNRADVKLVSAKEVVFK